MNLERWALASRQLILEEAATRFEQTGHDIWSTGEAAEFVRSLSHPDKEKGDG